MSTDRQLGIAICIGVLLAIRTTSQARHAEPATQPRESRLVAVQIDHIADLVKVAVEDDILTARTAFGRSREEVRVVAPDARGLITLTVLDLADDESGRNFAVKWTSRTPDGSAEVITEVSATAGHLIIARGMETPDGLWNVQYIQTARYMIDPTSDEPPVKLYAQISGRAGGAGAVDLKLSAPSFTELRRKYPGEMNRYLRPILRDFGHEQAVFGADVRAQWQVLSADAQPDEQITAQVQAVIAKFESENYHEREQAAEELQKLGQPAALAVSRIDRSKFSPEQNSGIDTFLAPYLPLSAADVRRLGGSVDFLLDCIYTDDAILQKLAIARLENLAGRSLHLDTAQNAEARAAAIEEGLRQQLTSKTDNAATTKP